MNSNPKKSYIPNNAFTLLALIALMGTSACNKNDELPASRGGGSATVTPAVVPGASSGTEEASTANPSEELQCTTASAQTPLRIMSYNVENLHDTEHDAGKNDWEFLPASYPGKVAACNQIETNPYYLDLCIKADFNEARYQLKLHQLQRVIESTGKPLPQILALVEVENEKSVRDLADLLGYQHALVTNSPDERGMDVALLYNEDAGLKYVSHHEHVIALADPSRNILEVNFETNCRRPLQIFVNHWPSQSAPAPVRMQAASKLKEVIDATKKAAPETYILALGDFNVITADRPDPLFDGIQNATWANKLLDLDTLFRAYAPGAHIRLDQMPLGTYFYGTSMEWNLLDHAFLSQNLNNQSGLEVNVSSYRIVNPPFARTQWTYNSNSYLAGSVVTGIPLHYDFSSDDPNRAGFSDHFPILFELKEQAR